MAKSTETTSTKTPLTGKEAAAELKKINDQKKEQNQRAKELRATLNEGKEARKAQRSTQAKAKKLFRDRRTTILKTFPKVLKGVQDGDPVAFEAIVGTLEEAFDDMGEILRAQKTMLEDESATPDLSTFELPAKVDKPAKKKKASKKKPTE